VAGADVLVELAPEGWEQSPLLACFHPSVERVLQERWQLHHKPKQGVADPSVGI